MKVKRLIEVLQEYSPNQDVLLKATYGGYYHISDVISKEVEKQSVPDYGCGSYEDYTGNKTITPKKVIIIY